MACPISIPVIDLAAATGADVPRSLLDAVRAATEEVGIIQVVNHGVPQALSDEFSQRIGRLLGLPRARKAEFASPTGHPYRGWRQWPDDFGRLELERFNVGQFDNAADARAAGLPEEHLGLYAHANVWPADDPGLRTVAHQYIAAARGVAERILGLYAAAQGLPAGTFPVSPLPYLTLTVNDYPTWTYADTGRDEDKLLLLEHADGSAVTILAQEGDFEGLQVQLPDGDWLPVPIIPGALQVFSGTLLTRWTNGLLRPARHRVVAGGTVTRRSTAVFHYPSLSDVLEPLPAFSQPGQETDFEPVTGWDLVKDNVENYLKEDEDCVAWLNVATERRDTGFHDHDGSAVGVHVVTGSVANEGLPIGGVRGVRRYGAGESFWVPGTGIHRMDHEAGAVTVHVYSPPLRAIGYYEIVDGLLQRALGPPDEASPETPRLLSALTSEAASALR